MSAPALLILTIGVALSFVFFGLALKLARYDSREYKKNRARYKSIGDALAGRGQSTVGSVPDQRVQAAVSFNKRKRRFELNGKLSDHVIDEVFRA